MKKLDLLRLRKAVGISQAEMARRLGVQPSFLSAIENGRSRFPEEKIERLKDATGLETIEDYLVEETEDNATVPPHTHNFDETDSLTHLLRHIHNLAHKSDDMGSSKEAELLERIAYLSNRNDRLSDRIDELRSQVDSLREENFRLKEQLLRKQ